MAEGLTYFGTYIICTLAALFDSRLQSFQSCCVFYRCELIRRYAREANYSFFICIQWFYLFIDLFMGRGEGMGDGTAQLIEFLTHDQMAVGSNPDRSGEGFFFFVASTVNFWG